jgi:hypothetical protein
VIGEFIGPVRAGVSFDWRGKGLLESPSAVAAGREVKASSYCVGGNPGGIEEGGIERFRHRV